MGLGEALMELGAGNLGLNEQEEGAVSKTQKEREVFEANCHLQGAVISG